MIKTIIVIPCLFMDALYTQEVEGINYPEYFDSDWHARQAITLFENEIGEKVDHYSVQVWVDVNAETLIDSKGYDWSANLRSQASPYCSLWPA